MFSTRHIFVLSISTLGRGPVRQGTYSDKAEDTLRVVLRCSGPAEGNSPFCSILLEVLLRVGIVLRLDDSHALSLLVDQAISGYG
jgi:hypothetical protein